MNRYSRNIQGIIKNHLTRDVIYFIYSYQKRSFINTSDIIQRNYVKIKIYLKNQS
jgi:hypothetical protein